MSVTTFSTIQQAHVVTQAPSRAQSVVRHAATGGVIGAALGAGLSLTALPFIGALAAPIAAAVGGAAGILVGGFVGLLRSRSAGDHGRAGAMQLPPPPAGSGPAGAPPLPPSLPPR